MKNKVTTKYPLTRCLLCALITLLIGAGTPGAVEAQDCVSYNLISYDRQTFFIDPASSKLPLETSNYVGVEITNTSGSAINHLVVGVENLAGTLSLLPGYSGRQSFFDVAAGATVTGFFYLTSSATGSVTATQSYDFVAYSNPPDFVAPCATKTQTFTNLYVDPVSGEGDGFGSVYDVIEANANKVDGSLLTGTYEIGGGFTLTIFGAYGTVGAPGAVVYNPATTSGWEPDAFQLTGVRVDVSNTSSSGGTNCQSLAQGGGVDYSTNLLFTTTRLWISVPGDVPAGALDAKCYRVQYTFIIIGSTASATTANPRSIIASGTQAKWQTPSGIPAIPAIGAPNLTIDKVSTSPASVNDEAVLTFPGTPPVASQDVDYRVTVTNGGTATLTIDTVIDDIPANPGAGTFPSGYGGAGPTDASYVASSSSVTSPGSCMATAPQVTTDAPTGATRLVWIGPCTLGPGASIVIDYTVTVPNYNPSEVTPQSWVNLAAVRRSGAIIASDDVTLAGAGTLPVELTAFAAVLDGHAVELAWQTASETNNAGFYLEMAGGSSGKGRVFESLAFIDGHGTTLETQHYGYRIDGLEPGRYTFRLKQVDYDGTFDYSPEVEVAIGLTAGAVVEAPYPNPFTGSATFRFAVQREQAVRADLYDLLGRRVKVLFEDRVPSGQMQPVEIHGSDLSNGVYLLRVTGERFSETRRVTLLK